MTFVDIMRHTSELSMYHNGATLAPAPLGQHDSQQVRKNEIYQTLEEARCAKLFMAPGLIRCIGPCLPSWKHPLVEP